MIESGLPRPHYCLGIFKELYSVIRLLDSKCVQKQKGWSTAPQNFEDENIGGTYNIEP